MSDKNNLTPDGMMMADSSHKEPLFKDAPAGELMSSEDSLLLDRTKQSTPTEELLDSSRQQTVTILSEQEKVLQEFTSISTQTETLLKSYIDRPVAALSWIEDRKQADRISAFALRMLMCQESVERRINAAKERLDATGEKQSEKDKAKDDYIETLRKGIAVCKINAATMGHIEKALEKHAFLPVVVRACSFPLTQKTSRIDDNGEASLEEAQARLIAFRSMITFDYHKERGFVNGGSWLEDLEAFKLADRNAVEEGHLTQEQADKRYSWTHGYRFELPPESMIPKEGERNGVYKEQYDRMDFSILHTRMTCEQIEIAKGNPDPAVQEFAKQLEEVFFSFHHVYFKVSASGEDLFNKRGASQESKDKVMAKMAALSFRIGTLANDIRSALAAFATNASALSEEKKQESLKAFKAMSQVFYKEIPSDNALRKEYDFDSAIRKGNTLINTAAGLVQYAKGLTTADEDFEREFSAYYDARARRHEQNDAKIKEGVSVKYMDDTKGDQIRIEQRREQLATEEGRRLEEEQRLADLERAAETRSISVLRTNTMGLSAHIPKDKIEKLDDYQFNGNKYTGVGKAGAFFVRHGFISGGKLKDAMAAHIDRFLRSSEVTDMAAATASSNLSDASGLFSEDMTAHWSGFDLVADKLNAVKALSSAKSKEDILTAINNVKTAVGGAFSPTEPGPDSEYFTKYPYSAKIILMHKLLSQTPDTATFCEKGTRKQKKLAGEFTTRLEAVKHSMQKLYDTVTASNSYQDAMRTQREETTETAPSPQSVAMYDTKMSEPIKRTTVPVNYEQDYETSIALYNRLQGTETLAVRIGEDYQSFKQEHRRVTVDRMRTMFKNIDTSLLGLSKERERERLSMLAKEHVALPEYKLTAGPAAEEILKDSIRQRVLAVTEGQDADVTKALEEDLDMIFVEAKKRISADAPGGIKSPDDMGSLSPDQLHGYAAILSSRLGIYKNILAKPEYRSEVGFRRSLLGDVLSQNLETLSANALEIRYYDFLDKKEIIAAKQEVLSLGKSITSPRIYVDITKLTQSTAADKHSREIDRIKRMEQTDAMFDTLKGIPSVEIPMDFYYFSVLRGSEPANAVKCRTEYVAYLKKWQTDSTAAVEKLPKGKEKDGYKTRIADFIKHMLLVDISLASKAKNVFTSGEVGMPNYVYSGVAKLSDDLCETFGASIHEDERLDFEKKMQDRMLGYSTRLLRAKTLFAANHVTFTPSIEANIRRLLISNLSAEDFRGQIDRIIEAKKNPLVEVAVKQKDRRIAEFSSYSSGAYRPLLKILIEDKTFSDNLVAAPEAEWISYREDILARCKPVMDELLSHPYLEQYLIGKKTQIADLILRKETTDYKGELALDAYDTKLTSIKINGDETIGDIIEKNLQSKDKAKDGNLVINILLLDGVTAIIDKDKLAVYKKRSEENTANLSREIDRVLALKRPAGALSEEQKKELEAKEKAIRVAILHNERINIYSVDSAEYDYAKQVADWFSAIEDRNEEIEIIKDHLRTIKENVAGFVSRKDDGRKAFADYYSSTQSLRLRSITSKQSMNALNDDQYALVQKIMAEKDAASADGRLTDFYSQTLTRVAAHAGEADPEKALALMQLDYNIYLNAKSFLEIARSYLTDLYGKKDTRIESSLNGLFDLYGTEIISGGRLLGDKQNREMLIKSFDSFFKAKEEAVVAEFERFLVSDTGYSSTGSDKTATETTPFAGFKTREDFEKDFGKKASRSALKEYNALTPEERVLFGQLIAIDGVIGEPMGMLERMVRERGAASATKSDLIYSFIMDKPIQSANYETVERVLLTDGKFNTDLFESVLTVVRQVKEMKTSESFILTEKEYETMLSEEIHEEAYDHDATVTAMSDMIVTVEHWQNELKRDRTTPGGEKMFRYYSALRPFAEQMKAFLDKDTGEGDENEALKKIVKETYDDYNTLKGYARLLAQKKDPKSDPEKREKARRDIEMKFLDKLNTDVFKDRDRSREEFFDFMDEHLFHVDGVTKATIATRDRTEDSYPPEVLKAVKKIDQWIAMHANNWDEGNAENVFGTEILAHPIRERLFVYYAIEKDKIESIDSFDPFISQTYVPNLEAFTDSMTKSWWHVGSHLASLLKSTDFVRDKAFLSNMLANTGSLCFDKLSDAIRLLDDHDDEIGEQIESSSVSLLAKDDSTLPMEIREKINDRNQKYLFFHEQYSALERMTKEGKDPGDPELLDQERKMREALLMLSSADEEYEKQLAKDERVRARKEGEDRANEADATKGKLASGRDLVITLTGAAGSAGSAIKESLPPVWKLADLKEAVSATPPGFFTSLSAVSVLSQAFVAVAALGASPAEMPLGKKVKETANLIATGTSALQTTARAVSQTVGETAPEIFGSITAGGKVVSGVAEAWVDTVNRFKVSAAKRRAVKKAGKMAETAADRHEVRQAKELARSAGNVAKTTDRKLSSDAQDGLLTAAGGLSSLFLGKLGSGISGALSGVKFLKNFFGKSERKNEFIDDFIGMEALLKKFNELPAMRYDAETEDDKKKLIRKEVLKRLHSPSYDVFFTNLGARYARYLHKHIFYREDGSVITKADTKDIDERKDFRDLFPDTTFKYPDDASQVPSPTSAGLASEIIKTTS